MISTSQIKRIDIPKGRDPFVNTALISVGKGTDKKERFWISSWNSNVGSTAVLVDREGQCKTFHFKHNGFYSCVAENPETLWLCGDLSYVLKFNLTTGEIIEYPTGAPPALVFKGMVLDKKTGKLFASAFAPPKTMAFSFDTKKLKTVRIYEDICENNYMSASFKNNDGTYTFYVQTPGASFIKWDPGKEEIGEVFNPDKKRIDPHGSFFISDERGLTYIPGYGWYDGGKNTFLEEGPEPDREMTWIKRIGSRAWGVSSEVNGSDVYIWDMAEGTTKKLCTIADSTPGNITISDDGYILSVNLYGEFHCFDSQNGALIVTKRLPTDSWGHVDCLIKVDEDRIVGTPFITQRFWEANVKTGKGFDCGRAAPGGGEIMQITKVGKMIYMAAYTGGEMVEYDPSRHPAFPENPRVVADPPGGMRPVAITLLNDRYIFYSSSHYYGNLGSIVTKYDTKTGMCKYFDNVTRDQITQSLYADNETSIIYAAATMHADCRSCKPSLDYCTFYKADENMKVLVSVKAPSGSEAVAVYGKVDGGNLLAGAFGSFGAKYYLMDGKDLELTGLEDVPGEIKSIRATGTPGIFVIQTGSRILKWNIGTNEIDTLYDEEGIYKIEYWDKTLYLVKAREVILIENLNF